MHQALQAVREARKARQQDMQVRIVAEMAAVHLDGKAPRTWGEAIGGSDAERYAAVTDLQQAEVLEHSPDKGWQLSDEAIEQLTTDQGSNNEFWLN